jgi:hypothetical protein
MVIYKKVLLGSRQLSDETDPKTLGDREEQRDNTFISGYPRQSVKDPIDTFYNNADEPIGAKRNLNYKLVFRKSKNFTSDNGILIPPTVPINHYSVPQTNKIEARVLFYYSMLTYPSACLILKL